MDLQKMKSVKSLGVATLVMTLLFILWPIAWIIGIVGGVKMISHWENPEIEKEKNGFGIAALVLNALGFCFIGSILMIVWSNSNMSKTNPFPQD